MCNNFITIFENCNFVQHFNKYYLMNNKKEIVICLGSSCFARGNKQTVKVIAEYLKANKLENEVFYHGNHCFGKCDKGPFVKIDDVMHENVDSENIIEILDKIFKRKK